MDETVLALLAFSGTLALTLLVAFNVNNFLGKIFGAAANILSRYFTTSIEIHAHYGCSSNVTNWLKRLIEHNCGAKLGHFAITNDIISSKVEVIHTPTISVKTSRKTQMKTMILST